MKHKLSVKLKNDLTVPRVCRSRYQRSPDPACLMNDIDIGIDIRHRAARAVKWG